MLQYFYVHLHILVSDPHHLPPPFLSSHGIYTVCLHSITNSFTPLRYPLVQLLAFMLPWSHVLRFIPSISPRTGHTHTLLYFVTPHDLYQHLNEIHVCYASKSL